MGLKIKNVNIKGVHQFLVEGGQFVGSFAKIGWRVFFFFLAGGGVDTSMHTDLILVHAGT